MSVRFVNVCSSKSSSSSRTSRPQSHESLFVSAIRDGKSSAIRVQVSCNNMEIVGEFVQDLCKFLNVAELESEADFPNEFSDFNEVSSLAVGLYEVD